MTSERLEQVIRNARAASPIQPEQREKLERAVKSEQAIESILPRKSELPAQSSDLAEALQQYRSTQSSLLSQLRLSLEPLDFVAIVLFVIGTKNLLDVYFSMIHAAVTSPFIN